MKTEQSKRLAYVLRHKPESIGISLDPKGWTEIVPLLHNLGMSRNELQDIVDTDNKGRYTIRGSKIRANQGHSIEGIIAFDLTPIPPPPLLFHGTSWEAYGKIRVTGGIKKMRRHHVHLSADSKTAFRVGQRCNRMPVILWVDSEKMYQDKYDFFLSDNGVWMTDHVPLKYILTAGGAVA